MGFNRGEVDWVTYDTYSVTRFNGFTAISPCENIDVTYLDSDFDISMNLGHDSVRFPKDGGVEYFINGKHYVNPSDEDMFELTLSGVSNALFGTTYSDVAGVVRSCDSVADSRLNVVQYVNVARHCRPY